MGFALDRIDHIVLNCRDPEATIAWYRRALGMRPEEFGPERRVALRFGDQKLNVRKTGTAGWGTAAVDAPGSLDLCFVTAAPIEEVVAHLSACGVEARGPVPQNGALGPMSSVYCSDPDGNLVEIAAYPASR